MHNTAYKRRRLTAATALLSAAEDLVYPDGYMPTQAQLLEASGVSGFLFRNAFGSVEELVHAVLKDRFTIILAESDSDHLVSDLATLSLWYRKYLASMSRNRIVELAEIFIVRCLPMDTPRVNAAMLFAICMINNSWPSNEGAAQNALNRVLDNVT